MREGVGKSVTSMRTLNIPDELIPVLRQQIAGSLGRSAEGRARLCADAPAAVPRTRRPPAQAQQPDHHLAAQQPQGGVQAPPVHTLRHTTATAMLAAGVDIATVAAQLGHSSPAITTRIYLHPDEERSRAGAATLGGISGRRNKRV